MDAKKIFSFSLFFFFILGSCSKDTIPDTSFMGTWLLKQSERQNCDIPEQNSDKSGRGIFNEPCTVKLRLFCTHEQYNFSETSYTRTSSGSAFAIPYSNNDEGSYTLSGNTLTVCEIIRPGTESCKVFEYAINGNILSLTRVSSSTGCTQIRYYKKQ